MDEGKPLVEVYAVTLMPNHFHILAKQLTDKGITKWLHRTCNSFSHAFNLIRSRKGTLFMGRFKAIPVLDNGYPWSSLGMYSNDGIKVLDEIKQLIKTDFMLEFIKEYGGIEAGMRDWGAREFDEFEELFLEN